MSGRGSGAVADVDADEDHTVRRELLIKCLRSGASARQGGQAAYQKLTTTDPNQSVEFAAASSSNFPANTIGSPRSAAAISVIVSSALEVEPAGPMFDAAVQPAKRTAYRAAAATEVAVRWRIICAP